MSTDLFVFGLSVLTVVALLVLVATSRDNSGHKKEEQDRG